ncbi:phage tail tape measure protein [Natrialba sp. INN-245]|nr:phage tail tape measure protein [Natrialba sp. INN-245]MWV40127.1 phage tail tape measure protein [Natrialba sp. INN-245]
MTAGISAPLAGIAAASLKTASEVEEMESKFSEVFQSSADDVTEWADTHADEIGRSQHQLQEYAAGFGSLLDAMGASTDETAEMSQELTSLTADLASFENMSEQQVQSKLESALSGQGRAVRDFGVNLSAAREEQILMNEGIAESREEATQAELAQARLIAIQEDTATAAGDAARTSESFANQTRALKADISEMRAEIGQHLLPVATSLLDRVRGLTGWFADLSDTQQQLTVGLGAVALAAGPLIAGFGTLLTLIPAMQAGWAALAAVKLGAVVPAAAATVTALSPILAPLAAITAAVGALWYAWDNNLGGIQDLTRDVASSIVGAIRPVISVLRDGVGEAVSTLQQRWQTFVSVVRPPLESLFNWFGGIYNQYVQPVEEDFIQTAEVWQAAFMGFVEWIQPYLQQFFDWYVGTIQDNLETVQAFWNDHGDTIMAIVRPFVETVEYLFTSMMDTLSTVVRAGLAVLRGDFEGAVTMLNDLLERQVDRFTDYGRSMMEALADGIRAMASAPVDAVEGVVDDVRDRLPSSPAEEGPLSDLDESGEALPQTFGQGIEDGSGDLDRTLETQLEGMDSPGIEPLAQASANGQGGQSSQDPLTREDLTVAFKRALQEVVFETNVDFNDREFNRFIDDRASTVVDEKLTKSARRASTRMG